MMRLDTVWDFAGTSSIFHREKGEKVNLRLRFHIVGGLRVVDASAIPLVSTPNLQATVYGFAEKATGLIAAGWKKEYFSPIVESSVEHQTDDKLNSSSL